MLTNAKVSRTQYTNIATATESAFRKKNFHKCWCISGNMGQINAFGKASDTHREKKKLITIRGILFCETSRGKLGRTRIHLTVDSRRRRVICD